MTRATVTGITRNCDPCHKVKCMNSRCLRTGPAGVTIAATHLGEVSDVHGVLKPLLPLGENADSVFLLFQHGVAAVTVFRHRSAIRAEVLSIMAAEASIEIKMADVGGVGLPVQLHFRKSRAAEDTLRFVDRV